MNYVLLVDPYKDAITYVNKEWNASAVESQMSELAFKNVITVDQIKQYSRNLYFLCHFNEVTTPSFTQRALTIPKELIARRDELLKKYAKEIEAGDPVVISKIESELIAADKSQLKGDPSTGFYDTSKKSYETHRKQMMIMFGMIPKFGEPGYTFIPKSLEEGWDVKNFQAIANEIRRGSYNRAKETAKGGEESKFLSRIFQNTDIVEEDCGTTRYWPVEITDDNKLTYINRNIFHRGKLLTLTKENVSSFVGTTVQMRSPSYCITKNYNYCYTCMGEYFRYLHQKNLALQVMSIGSTMLGLSMKSMHQSNIETAKIKNLSKYTV